MTEKESRTLDAIQYGMERLRQWLDSEELLNINACLINGGVVIVNDAADNWGIFQAIYPAKEALQTMGV